MTVRAGNRIYYNIEQTIYKNSCIRLRVIVFYKVAVQNALKQVIAPSSEYSRSLFAKLLVPCLVNRVTDDVFPRSTCVSVDLRNWRAHMRWAEKVGSVSVGHAFPPALTVIFILNTDLCCRFMEG